MEDYKSIEDGTVHIPELDGYYALLLSILKDYSASKSLRYIKKGKFEQN